MTAAGCGVREGTYSCISRDYGHKISEETVMKT